MEAHDDYNRLRHDVYARLNVFFGMAYGDFGYSVSMPESLQHNI